LIHTLPILFMDSNGGVVGEACIEECWESGKCIVIVTIPLSPSSLQSGEFETGLSSATCLQVNVGAGTRLELVLPRAVCDDGPLASAKLSRKRGKLVVRLPAKDSEIPPSVEPVATISTTCRSLVFGELAATNAVTIASRHATEGRLLKADTLQRNLFWVRGLVEEREASRFLAVARSMDVMWDITSADSVDGFPVFETYLIRDGVMWSGPFAEQLPRLMEPITAYVQRRYQCPSASVCHCLLRRYLPEERRIHPSHYDAHAFVTVVVALNPGEYEGGLYVQQSPRLATRQYPRMEPGDILVHSYDLLHGVRTYAGIRYSLIFWFKDSPEACTSNTSPWYLAAAKCGDDAAQYNLGTNLEHGRWGCQRDPLAAAEWYERSASQGNFMALTALAALSEGDGSDDKAERLYERAAALGSSTAMMNLARLHTHGLCGCARNEEAAARWLKAAANEENAEALCILGKAHVQGRGVPRDRQLAAEFFLKSAELGYPEAQLRTGLALAQGWNGDADLHAAAMWYRKAARQGQAQAAESLKVLEEHGIVG